MLANLTSLFWGSEGTDQSKTVEEDIHVDVPKSVEDSDSFISPSQPQITDVTVISDDENDWVLVNRKECCGSENSSPTPGEAGGAEAGWLVTPPPCFTQSQGPPLATSPMENLLIEHPSMSVYIPASTASTRTRFRYRQHTTTSSRPLPAAPTPDLSQSASPVRSVHHDAELLEERDEQQQQQPLAIAGAEGNTRAAGVAQRTAELLQVIDVLRPAQKAQRRREERRLKGKQLDRSNKAREVDSSCNKRSKRRNMLTPCKFSRAINNRKC
ncbi:tumor protein p53 inducible nuclear protein isoform X2 [Oratosquilla oratoria]